MSSHPFGEDELNGPPFLTQRELELRWKLSGRTLERWRAAGKGPVWTTLGKIIRYRLDDVRAFEARHRPEDLG